MMSDAESPIIPRIIRDLSPFLLEASEDILFPVLETVFVLGGVASSLRFTTDLAEALTAAPMDVRPKNIKGMFCFLTQSLAAKSGFGCGMRGCPCGPVARYETTRANCCGRV